MLRVTKTTLTSYYVHFRYIVGSQSSEKYKKTYKALQKLKNEVGFVQ